MAIPEATITAFRSIEEAVLTTPDGDTIPFIIANVESTIPTPGGYYVTMDASIFQEINARLYGLTTSCCVYCGKAYVAIVDPLPSSWDGLRIDNEKWDVKTVKGKSSGADVLQFEAYIKDKSVVGGVRSFFVNIPGSGEGFYDKFYEVDVRVLCKSNGFYFEWGSGNLPNLYCTGTPSAQNPNPLNLITGYNFPVVTITEKFRPGKMYSNRVHCEVISEDYFGGAIKTEGLYLYLYGDTSGRIYSYQEGLQFEVADGLCAQSFGSYGMLAPPPEEILSTLDRPKVYRWTDLMPSALPLTAKVWAIPTENTVESIVDLSQAVTLISITAQYSGDVRVSWSYDNGGTWTEPRPMAEFLQVPMSEIWRGMDASKKIRFRLALESSGAELKQFLVRWGRENGS